MLKKLFITAAALALCGALQAEPKSGFAKKVPGYGELYVIMANGENFPASSRTTLDTSFYSDTLGLSDQEIADLEEQAKQYYLDYFGITVIDGGNGVDAGGKEVKLFFSPFVVNQDVINFRLMASSKSQVGASGVPLYTGGWFVVATSEPIMLGGAYAQRPDSIDFLPPGGQLQWGDYYFEHVPGKNNAKGMRLHYEAADPATPSNPALPGAPIFGSNNRLTFEDQSGFANGSVLYYPAEDDGNLSVRIRIVLNLEPASK